MSRIRKGLAALVAASVLLVATAGIAAAAGVSRRTILPGTRFATTLYIIDSGRPGPTVWITGGVHGSELAGWKAAEQIADWNISRGRLIVIPHANRPAVLQQRRSAAGDPDLNRQFPERSGQSPKGTLANALWQELRRYDPDWVFDLHEAMSNYNTDRNSVGQSMIVYPRSAMLGLARRVVQRMNGSLSSTRKFNVLRYPVGGSLANAAGDVLGMNATIVETSRQFPLQTRVNWHLRLVRYALEDLNMSPRTASAADVAVASITSLEACGEGSSGSASVPVPCPVP